VKENSGRRVLTDFIIEHQCPQCGAPAELNETDRLFRCEFCRVGSYLTVPSFFRYVLPQKAPAGKELIYFPYWRFKGMLFSCLKTKIANRFIDSSQQAIPSMHFPVSVGFRSQTQKLHFATSDYPGIYLRPHVDIPHFLKIIDDHFSSGLPKPILHQAQIGETLSLLYAPFYTNGKLYDAILNEPLPAGRLEDVQSMLQDHEAPSWQIKFIATLCPQCGWDLKGVRNSLVLNCTNCHTAWWEKKGRLKQLSVAHASIEDKDACYLPFWRIKADVSHIRLQTYADLIKVANLPKVPQPGWDRIPFSFWSPAFKVKPQSLLTFANKITLNQPLEALVPEQPRGNLQAVTMPLEEAVQSLKLMVSSFMRPRERMAEVLPDLQVTAQKALLVYLPFREGHHEFIHQGLNLAVNKNILRHAVNL
jgi:predicted RNA-binding Zn-ribbon protein involved in translation (DUF1610 family)